MIRGKSKSLMTDHFSNESILHTIQELERRVKKLESLGNSCLAPEENSKPPQDESGVLWMLSVSHNAINTDLFRIQEVLGLIGNWLGIPPGYDGSSRGPAPKNDSAPKEDGCLIPENFVAPPPVDLVTRKAIREALDAPEKAPSCNSNTEDAKPQFPPSVMSGIAIHSPSYHTGWDKGYLAGLEAASKVANHQARTRAYGTIPTAMSVAAAIDVFLTKEMSAAKKDGDQ